MLIISTILGSTLLNFGSELLLFALGIGSACKVGLRRGKQGRFLAAVKMFVKIYILLRNLKIYYNDILLTFTVK